MAASLALQPFTVLADSASVSLADGKAAAETSILSKMGKTYDETKLDLSEHHLAWFARTHLQDGSSQDGEGTYMLDDAPELNTGGMLFTATSLFSSGIGVVNEGLIPYRGKNSKTESKLYLNYCYSSEDDWSVPAEYEFFQSYELENSDILQSPAVYDTFVTRDSEQDEREEGYLGYIYR